MAPPKLLTPSFCLVWLSTLCTVTATAILLPTLPVYADGPLGVGKTGVGVVMAATAPAIIVLQPLIGRYADRFGRRVFLLAGPLVYCSCLVLFPLADSPAALVALRALSGVGEAAILVVPATIVNDLAPDARRGEAVSLFSLAIWLGFAVGPPLGELVLRDTHFDAVWLTAAGVMALGAAFGAFVAESRPEWRSDERGPRRLLSRPAILPGLVLLVQVIGFASLAAFTSLYARELGMSGAGLVFMSNALVVLAIRGLGRTIPDRLGSRRGAVAGLLLGAGGLATIAVVHHPVGLFLGSGMFYGGHSLLYPALMMLVVGRARPTERSMAVGTFSAFAGIGFAVGPIAFGAIASAAGYQALFGIAAGIILLGLAPIARLGPAARSPAPEAPP